MLYAIMLVIVYLAEDDVLQVQPGERAERYKKLRVVAVSACIRTKRKTQGTRDKRYGKK